MTRFNLQRKKNMKIKKLVQALDLYFWNCVDSDLENIRPLVRQLRKKTVREGQKVGMEMAPQLRLFNLILVTLLLFKHFVRVRFNLNILYL